MDVLDGATAQARVEERAAFVGLGFHVADAADGFFLCLLVGVGGCCSDGRVCFPRVSGR